MFITSALLILVQVVIIILKLSRSDAKLFPINAGWIGWMIKDKYHLDVYIDSDPDRTINSYCIETKRVNLSPDLISDSTAEAVAVIAHELGHAMAPYTIVDIVDHWIRHAFERLERVHIRPVYLCLFGLYLHSPAILTLGLIMQALRIISGVMKLRPEYYASTIASRVLPEVLGSDHMPGIRSYLVWAFLTYVRSLAMSMVVFLYMIRMARFCL